MVTIQAWAMYLTFVLEHCDELREKSISSRKLFFQAFLVAASNPKAFVFLTALLPRFITRESSLYLQVASRDGRRLAVFSMPLPVPDTGVNCSSLLHHPGSPGISAIY
ncbi:MAG: hypothetical protein CSA52_02045 [Gammaproteobacteria bacterium]|nr:MAG: hypothetical protein CSA52_02045 [Gammaproteobacteria bacterium]